MPITITRTGANTVITQTGLSNISISASTEVEITYNEFEEFINILLVASTEPPIALEVAEFTTVNGVDVTGYTIAQLAAYISANCFGVFDQLNGESPVFKINGTLATSWRGIEIQQNGTTIAEVESYASTGETRISSGFVGYGGFLTIYTDGVERVRIKSTGVINLPNLPTSSAGLSAGDIWNDSGTIKIV